MTFQTLATSEDLQRVQQQAPDRRFELIDGEIQEVSASFVPSAVAIAIAIELGTYLKEHDLGYLTGADGSYIMDEAGQNVFMPDVGFISYERLPEMPEGFVPAPPDFAVEVVSPSDSVKAVQRKARRYLSYGTRCVWIVYPQEQSVDICTPAPESGMTVHEYGLDAVLPGGDVFPGLTLPVRLIFQWKMGQ